MSLLPLGSRLIYDLISIRWRCAAVGPKPNGYAMSLRHSTTHMDYIGLGRYTLPKIHYSTLYIAWRNCIMLRFRSCDEHRGASRAILLGGEFLRHECEIRDQHVAKIIWWHIRSEDGQEFSGDRPDTAMTLYIYKLTAHHCWHLYISRG